MSSDPMGTAILDYQTTGRAARLKVLSSMFDDDEIPVSHLFRALSEMPPLEQKALSLARGRVLDVGAGAGCHSLVLQENGMDVTAVDISQMSCEAMRLRGLRDVRCLDILSVAIPDKYDTVLLLMNGTGIAGTADRLPFLLSRVAALLAEGGEILIDSSDLKYLYENEDGSFDIDLMGPYYGEVDYQMSYKGKRGEPFMWLYSDFGLLSSAAAQAGLKCELVAEGEHYDYLARITRK